MAHTQTQYMAPMCVQYRPLYIISQIRLVTQIQIIGGDVGFVNIFRFSADGLTGSFLADFHQTSYRSHSLLPCRTPVESYALKSLVRGGYFFLQSGMQSYV